MAQSDALHPIKTALVAEDNEPVREFIKEVLEEEGYHVLLAGDGLAATSLCQGHPEISLIITDILMPGKDGLEFIMGLRQAFRGQLARPKIVAISGGGRLNASLYLDDASLYGADLTLHKPFTRDELLHVLSPVDDARV